MPTGTRSSIRENSATKPSAAAASELIASASFERLGDRVGHKLFGVNNEPPGAHGDEDDGRDVANPGDREEWPGRQMKVEGEDMVGARRAHLVEQRRGVNGDDEQEHQGGEHVDGAFSPRTRRSPYEVDGDVAAAIAGRRDAPEDQDAQQHPAEIVGIGNRRAEQIAKQDGDENVDGDNADERGGGELDAVDEPVHRIGRHARAPPGRRSAHIPAPYLAIAALSSVSAASGSAPACFTALAQLASSGFTVARHAAIWSGVSL